MAVAGVGLWQNLQPIPAYARESFSGIKKVVESYDEENPFVILDIVPGTATYTYTYIDTNMVAEAPSTLTVPVEVQYRLRHLPLLQSERRRSR